MSDVLVTSPKSSAQPLTAASRLVSGGLSFLLVLAFALASGVPAGRLLATAATGGTSLGGIERAVAPEVVERQTQQHQQERPDAAHAFVATLRPTSGQPSMSPTAAAERSAPLLREALLALPPPAV